MNLRVLFELLFIGLSFATWPILINRSGISGTWPAVIVVTATVVTQLLFSVQGLTSLPALGWVFLFLLAGVANGIAILRYAHWAADPTISASALVTLASSLMIVFGALLDWALNGATPAWRQVAGYGSALLTVYLLAGPK